MKIYLISIFLLISSQAIGQNLSFCGLDNNPELTKSESDYLNAYLFDKRNGFDFENKKVIFITGNSGYRTGTKKEYFDFIKEWNKRNSQVATGINVLTDEQKAKTRGYDIIITYWVKQFTKRRKNKIINAIQAGNNI
ncbi:MAG: hypothetical protein ACQEWG_12655 [Bacteroidota bacterium]